MAIYRAPGVYVREDQTTPMPLRGVPTGIPCFFGVTQQGPSRQPVRIKSLTEFTAVFGATVRNTAVFPNTFMSDAIYGFFLNGGSECWVVRVNAGDAAEWPIGRVAGVIDWARVKAGLAKVSAPVAVSLTVKARSGGSWGNRLRVRVAPTSTEGARPPMERPVTLHLEEVEHRFATVAPAQLAPTSDVPIPSAAALTAAVKLRVGDGAPVAWDPSARRFVLSGPVLAETTGVLLRADDDTTGIPVKVLPDNTLTVADIQCDGGCPDAVVKTWPASTAVRFRNVKVDEHEIDVEAKWDPDEGRFYVTDADGKPCCPKRLPNGAAGVLSEPQRLPDGFVMGFDLDVLEPVPPRHAGERTTYRLVERYAGLSTNPDDPAYFLKENVVNGISNRIEVAELAPAPKTLAFLATGAGAEHETVVDPRDPTGADPLVQGGDSAPSAKEYADCFELLKQVPDVSLIACPDAFSQGEKTPAFVYQPIFQSAVAFAEQNRCLAVIDVPPLPPAREPGDLAKSCGKLQTFADRFRSTHGAIYAPWLLVPNLDPTVEPRVKAVPPSGFMLGAFNRSDETVGVWKAPANMPVLGPVGLQLPFTDDDSEVLNPAGVNLVRSFPGRGTLIWGARTTTTNVMWQYVNVRRLFLYVERTLKQQTLWAVFEPNDQRTWVKLTNAADSFLRGLWLAGGLMGATPEEAFRVQCGIPQTMTMDDIANGLLKVEIAIAPVRPAEFVVFTISQLVQTAKAA